jgi:tRNA threonylcarbamoyladenosine biosynthesis protein TsaB
VILALDSSTSTLALALLTPELMVLEAKVFPPLQKQSQLLPNELNLLLRRHQVGLGQLTRLVCGLGPGSFTGLRLGLSTLKGLSYALQIPLCGGASLAALANELSVGEREIFVIALVKRGEFYVGHFVKTAQGLIERSPVTSMPVALFAAHLKQRPQAVVCGPALAEYREALRELGCDTSGLLEAPSVPSAVQLARLAPALRAFSWDELFSLEPNYVRGSAAEENLKFPPIEGLEAKARIKSDES